MNENTTAATFTLASRHRTDPAPVLVGVQAEGRLDTLLLSLTLRQTYRNTSAQVLEVIYTFPLPPDAVLLGFASELQGQRQEGVVTAKRDAEQRYETSLHQGDAPVMLETSGLGVHTANIGNLKPGDEIVLECRYAQWLRFDQGRLRVSFPTTLAPRYGHPNCAGLQPQQVPLSSLVAEYPLRLSLTLGPTLAGATPVCPTHAINLSQTAEGLTRLDLAPTARLDRDVVVTVTPSETRPSLLVRAHDAHNPAAPHVVMAALQLPRAQPRQGLALKVLVDCSGSMAGDSIASARAALHGVAGGLGEHDQLAISRFGNTVDHVWPPMPVQAQAMRYLRSVIDTLQADLGGTEMAAAMRTVFELPMAAETGGADLLLITDGNIWQIDETITAARASGHRIFAIGVGSAPTESVLQLLAQATGGACEMATPGEALEAAARRMLDRMRQPTFGQAQLEWGRAPAWVLAPVEGLFGGDTVMALAAFDTPVPTSAVRLLATNAQGQRVELARAEADAPCPGDTLPRMAAARRLLRRARAGQEIQDAPAVAPQHAPLSTHTPQPSPEQTPEQWATQLALQYQLMSPHTHCILVHERARADQATGQAQLHRVPNMMAAGWGGSGTVGPGLYLETLGVRQSGAPTAARAAFSRAAYFDLSDSQPCVAPKLIEPLPALLSLQDVVKRVQTLLLALGHPQGLAARMEALQLPAKA